MTRVVDRGTDGEALRWPQRNAPDRIGREVSGHLDHDAALIPGMQLALKSRQPLCEACVHHAAAYCNDCSLI